MERLKRSLTSNLDSERSTSTLSRSSSREWLDALEKELSPADQSSGDFSVKLSEPPRALIDDNNISISANFVVGDVLKRALTLKDEECETNEEKEEAAARDANGATRKRRGGRRKTSFSMFSNKNNDLKKVTKTTDEAKPKQLGCVWKVQDIRQSYPDVIYRRRSSNFSGNKKNNQANSRGEKSRQNQRNSLRSSISSLCSSLRGSDVLNLPKEYDIDDKTRKSVDGENDELPPDCDKKNNNGKDCDSFSTLASIEEQMRTRYAFTGHADR